MSDSAADNKPVEETPPEAETKKDEPATSTDESKPSTEESSTEPAAEGNVAEKAEEKSEENTEAKAEDKTEEEQKAEETQEPEPAPEPIEIPSGNGELVLVTGSTGYLASHIIKLLLESGEFKVRGTVRSTQENEKLEKLKSLVENSKYTAEFVEADLTKPDSWAEAVKGCDYVIHTASPFPITEPSDPSEVIDPARDGTLAVLKACSESGTVKRVVLTSSCNAISAGRPVEKNSLTEETWSDLDKTISAYDKSKIIAERAAWDFMKELPEGNTMELSVVNPGLILGPPMLKMDSTSIEVVKKLMNREYPMVPKLSFPVTDVRDVALAHMRAMMIKQAAGHRHIVCSSSCWLKDMANMLSQEFNSKGFNIPTAQAPYVLVWIKSHFDATLKRVMPELGKMHTFDNTRMKTVLQVEPRDVKSSLVEMGHALINLEIVQKLEKPEKKPRKLTFRKKKEKVEEGEEKKDEPEKIKDGSANGSADNVPVDTGDANVEEIKVEVNEGEAAPAETQPASAETAEEPKAEQPAADGEKPAEEGAAVSSEEEVKQETPDPESKKNKDKKEKKEKKKKGSIFSFSFKRNKKPQVEKKEKPETEQTAEGATTSDDAAQVPAAEEAVAPATAEEAAPATSETPAEQSETPAKTEAEQNETPAKTEAEQNETSAEKEAEQTETEPAANAEQAETPAKTEETETPAKTDEEPSKPAETATADSDNKAESTE